MSDRTNRQTRSSGNLTARISLLAHANASLPSHYSSLRDVMSKGFCPIRKLAARRCHLVQRMGPSPHTPRSENLAIRERRGTHATRRPCALCAILHGFDAECPLHPWALPLGCEQTSDLLHLIRLTSGFLCPGLLKRLVEDVKGPFAVAIDRIWPGTLLEHLLDDDDVAVI